MNVNTQFNPFGTVHCLWSEALLGRMGPIGLMRCVMRDQAVRV
jgi:hypothetical protein